MIKKNSISLVISAPSGAGKSTIIKQVMDENPLLTFSVSTTTRKPREGEGDGVSYYYTDEDTFRKMADADEFVEWAHVHTSYYGTSKKEIDRIKAAGKIPVFDVDVQGSKNLRDRIEDAVLIFIMPPSINTLAERLRGRNTESELERATRLENARKEMNECWRYDYIIINDRLEDAVADFKSIIRAELLSTKCMCQQIETILED